MFKKVQNLRKCVKIRATTKRTTWKTKRARRKKMREGWGQEEERRGEGKERRRRGVKVGLDAEDPEKKRKRRKSKGGRGGRGGERRIEP